MAVNRGSANGRLRGLEPRDAGSNPAPRTFPKPAGSSNGRTGPSERPDVGSIPAPATCSWKSSGRMRSLSRKQVRLDRCGFESHGFRSQERQTTDSRPRGAARSARYPVTVEIVGSNPIGDADPLARYANWQSGEAQNFVIDCGFDSHPCYSIGCVGWALASPSGRNPPACWLCRFNSCPAHSNPKS